MKVRHAIIAATAAVVVAVVAGAGVAVFTRSTPLKSAGPLPATSSAASPSSDRSPSPSPRTSSPDVSASPDPSATAEPTAEPTAAATGDPLSEENLLRERAYHDATGRDFTLAPRAGKLLGPCTGDVTFADALPRRLVSTRSIQLDGPDGAQVIEHMAQTSSVSEARTAATEIIAEVKKCVGIQGGDFGYGDPVTVGSDDDSELVYFPAYDSDRAFGGYIVIQTGHRVGVVDVRDAISVPKLVALAKLAAEIAAV